MDLKKKKVHKLGQMEEVLTDPGGRCRGYQWEVYLGQEQHGWGQRT